MKSKQDTELVRGGQGRSAEDIEFSGRVVVISIALAVAFVAIFAAIAVIKGWSE